MATLLLTAVGTAIGGPLGGAIGAFLGQQADQALIGSGNREGPRLKELAVTTSSYGQPIPRHFGRMRVAGSIIWATDLREEVSKEGGGKGKPSVTSYSYSSSFAVALSSTPIASVGRIWANGDLLRGAGGDLKTQGTMRTYLGTGDNAIDPLIAADKGSNIPAFRDYAYIVFEDLQLADFGNRIPALTFEIFSPEGSNVALSDLVPSNASDLTSLNLDHARGFSDEGGSLARSLAAIDRAYPLVCRTAADGLIVTSATNVPEAVPTLSEQLIDARDDEGERRNLQRGHDIGREPIALRYYDEGRDYQPGVQRALGAKPAGQEVIVNLPATLTAAGARALANDNAHRARWHHERIVWRMGELDPDIGPGSVVKIPDISGSWRVISWEWHDRGIELELERIAPSLGATIPSDPGDVIAPADLVIPPTLLRVVETPSDGTTDPNQPALFAAASSASQGWKGAALYLQQDASLLEIGVTSKQRSVIGHLASPMPSSDSLLFEQAAHLTVQLVSEDLGFTSTDIVGLTLGANRLLVAGEVIQFLNAQKQQTGEWKLSGLLRGRAGTEPQAKTGHAAMTSVVLINDQLTALDGAIVPNEAGTSIAAIGLGDDEAMSASLQNPGLSRQPLVPVHARSEISSDGTLHACWTRRSRGQWRWHESVDVPMIEEREEYLVGFGPIDSPFASWTVSTPEFSVTEGERNALTSANGSGDLWVRQVGTFAQSATLLIAELL